MQNIARKVDEELPDNFGFIVLAFKFNEKGEMIQENIKNNYCSKKIGGKYGKLYCKTTKWKIL